MAIFQVTNIISTLEKLPLKNGYIYYIANLDNLSDIMSHGISAISTDPKRSHAEPIYGKAISEYVSLYFNPRNATLYSAQKSYGSKVIILQIHKTALLADGVIFTNASATAARYECANELSDLLNTQFISWSEVMSKGWNHANKSIKQSKRDKMMAEALVPTHLPIDMIAGIICQDSFIAKSIASDYNITAVADMEYFFPIKLYAPQTKDELENLICDEDIYLGDIDTSAITDMSELFYESGRKDFSGIDNWDVSSVTNMHMMFYGCENFNQPLNNWDVSSVTDMSGMFGSVIDLDEMFRGCENFNQPLNNWDVSSVTDMRGMFEYCTNFNQPLNSWDVSSVTDMREMFRDCENFNQPLDSWDVSSVTSMSEMFAGCENFNQSLNNWDVSSVTDMYEMFRNCENFNQPLDSWRDKLSQELIDELLLTCFVERKIVNNKTRHYPKTKDELRSLVREESLNLGDIDTSAITDMSWLFYESWRKDFSGIENWDVSSVTDMSGMFRGCENFNQPLDNWNVSSVANMSDMFADCYDFNQPLNNWNVSSVTNMSAMFYECYNFNQSLDNWDVSSVTSMSYMFYDCKNFNQPLDNWDASSVTDMSEMFDGCINFNQPLNNWRDKLSQELIDELLLICFIERKIVNNKTRYYPKTKDELRSLVIAESVNLGDIDTSAITDMSELFYKIERKDFSGIESWDVSSVTDMRGMFAGVENFNQPLDSWDVSSVVNMGGMFAGCENFNQPLNNWNVSSVTNMCAMFAGCYNFNQPLDNWDVSSVTDMYEMFYNCENFNQPLNNWNVSSVTDMSLMFDGCKINDENKPKFTKSKFNDDEDDDEIPF
ncbi:DarT ssDNA thymidine ADP-ribosyltransferase family protein [Campylobacter sp. P091]|uniref:DarT ssDNA thymidine ADP-ribosyltransferase family protein n=1 Tax=Campylobacter sp. P091 TaxID=1895621 RepID=UPI000A35AB7F|nr:DarT ssDNA thymidine ADP-ribosyltransferase family protein [Campylobacter sp. P091]